MRSASSTRSLVLLVFILTSHIADVLARHHHIKLRHARHRRQHGESYIPASFVSDTDDEETGTWGPWSVPGTCSRSCGGGVAYQTRSCQDVDESTGDELCTGSKKRFFSCNIQECPEPSTDFRAEQCAEYNNVPIEGVYYDWVPYTGGPNKCELNCMPRGERFFYRHKLSVTDGTPCATESNDVCVQGKCRPVGCDMMLGSDAKEDNCRECGGDGSACNTVKGLLDMNDLQAGYNDILLIPEGATSILINELRPSNNYLAIRNTSGHYYLNGNWRIDFPRSLRFAGSVFHYERRPHEFSAADIISTLGPTTEAIYIVLLYQDNNVGVNYEYSIPKRFSQKSSPDSYTWVADEFSDCSTTCGGGIQSRLVRCVKRSTNEEVDENLCDQQLEPVGTQACGVEPCPAGWVVGNWGKCSRECGPGGEQSREIKCSQIISGGIPSIVDDARCLDLIGPKDIEIQECNKDIQCPQWHIGPWKPCNRLCGKGKETRKITCYKKENGKIFALDDSACEEERPESEKDCELRPCSGVDWVVSKWSGCDDKCGLTQETRTTSCVTLEGEVYPDEQCNPETKPKLVRECSTQEKCAFQWYAGQWSECSVKCGTGIQTRKVFCGTSLSDSESIQKVEDEKCDQDQKYNDTKDCVAEVEECKGEWFAGPWSECSKPCGGGEMTRKVICMKDNKVVKIKGNCYENDIMFSIEDCNKKACGDDEVTPVDPGKSIASPEDEEGEVECEDYQDDGFVSVDLDLDAVDYQHDEKALPLRSSFDEKSFEARLNDIMMGDGPLEDRGDMNGEMDNEDDSEEDKRILSLDGIFKGGGTEMDVYTYDSTESAETSETADTTDTDETMFTDSTESTITDSTVSSVSSSETFLSTAISSSEGSESTTATDSSSSDTTLSGTSDETSPGQGPTSPSSTDTTESSHTDMSTDSSSETSVSTKTDSTLPSSSDASSLSISETTGSSTLSSEVTDSVSIDTSTLSSSESTDSSSSETDSSSIDTSTAPSSETTILSNSDTTESSSSDTTVSSGSDTTESSKVDTTDTTVASSSEAPRSSSSDTTLASSSETPGSSSSDTTVTSSSETPGSSSSDTTVASSSETPASSSSDTTVASSSETPESSGSDTTMASSSETPQSSSSDTTMASSSETPESSSSDTTVTTSSGTPGSSSSDTTVASSSETPESSSSDTPESSSSDTTVTSSSETPGSSSSDTTVASSSETPESSSSDTTVASSSETLGSSSSDTTVTSSSEIPESSSSDTTVASSSETPESSSSDTTMASSSETPESSSSDTTMASSSETPESSSSDTTMASSSETPESSSSDTTMASSLETPESSSSDTTVASSSETPESSSSDTTMASSSETPESSSSDTTVASSSETPGSSSSDTTVASSSETPESSSSDTTVASSSETPELSDPDTTVASSSETPESSSSDTTVASSSETPESSSSDTTMASSSETPESSSSDTTVASSSETPESSSSDTTVASSSETPESSSSDTTVASSSEPPESSSSDTTVSSSSDVTESSSSDTTVLSSSETRESSSTDNTESSSTETTGWSSFGTTTLSSSETPESSSSDTTVSSSSEITGSSTSAGTAEVSSSETTESFSSSSATTVSASSSESSGSTESSSASTDVTGSESTESSGETSVMAETSESESTTVSGETDITNESDITTETDITSDITESGFTSETTESGITETDEDLDTTGQSHITDIWTTTASSAVPSIRGPRKCRLKRPKSCKFSQFGCCYDGVKAATGPFGKGCPIPKTCKEAEFGCCPDEVSPATGPDNEGCPDSHCSETLFGCCQDNVTPAEGNDYEGCPIPCDKSEFGCCPDAKTPASGKDNLGCCNVTAHGCCPDGIKSASGPDGKGCEAEETSTVTTSTDKTETATTSESTVTTTVEDEITSTSEIPITTTIGGEESCTSSEFGCCPDNQTIATGNNFEGCDIIKSEDCAASYYRCCPDGVTAALGPNNQGCHMDCENAAFGCCPDGSTPAHGADNEGCCLSTPYGCCPDNIQRAQGPDLYGCGCQYSRYGCCPDNTTYARGRNNEGCACEHTPHGCCPNRINAASGPDFEGCPCHTYQFGCCPDGVSIAKGSQNQGCGCENTQFKCCSDGVTPAKGENYAGCTCDASKYGCCPDGVEEAQGETFEGCLTVLSSPGAACALERDRGSCSDFTVKWFFDTEYGGCSRFWYGGCEGNDNRFKSQDECKEICVEPKGRDACFLPKIAGPCEGYHPTWYYDTERKQCGQFVYSGCLGNANKFKTKDECEDLCVVPDDIDPCEQPKEVGPCAGNFTRWYYNKDIDSCEEFAYGGCKGNKNNFQSEISCQQQCHTPGQSHVRDVCALEREPGPCPGSSLRWYYDAKRKSCRQFVFGGCKGNGNKFRTYAACAQRCPVRDSCALPREEGSCTKKQARWFFDQSENRCMPFYYTGCGGNRNNYESREACDSDCPPKIEQEICLLPALLGDCYNYTQRWYYDSYDQRCRQFYYGGCGGNENNFESEYDCKHRCTNLPTTPAPAIPEFEPGFCFMPVDQGPCDGDKDKWFYDRRDGICKPFRYGGCAGNGNNFDTAEECTQRCRSVQDLCDLPAVVGPCRAAFSRYYYDRRTDMCHKFIFGGCQGNDNNFNDKSHCEERCRKSVDTTTIAVPTAPTTTTTTTTTTIATPVTTSPPTSPICALPIDAGPCYEDVTAYYYDATAGACQAFEYGGCGGNANRFQTEEQCERLCGSFVGQDVCNIQADPGPCREAYPKFYYDPISRSCQSFEYGGCDGNANRFSSTEECESVCLHREEPPVPGNNTSGTDHAICSEPVSIGSCSIGSYKRFYYNDERGDCLAFIYTGCGGNRNRFKSYDSCIQTCIRPTNNPGNTGPPRPDSNDPCSAAQIECDTIRCPYGKEAYVDDQDCPRCRCADLCRDEICPEGSKCAITLVPQGDSTGYRSVCRSILKPGNCPRVSNTTTCQVECSSDADCDDDFKCCTSGCGSSCLQPAPTEPVTTPAPQFNITVPYPEARPATIEQPEEPNVRAEEGGYVILKCACGGNPRPIITWRKAASLIDSTLSRHSITIEGSLQIADLYRTDAGLYTCTADNRLAAPVRIQYQLDITDPHERTSLILGEPNYRVTVTLNSPTVLQCYVAGWPRPSVTWWHGDRLLPLQDKVYELQRDHSLRIHRVSLVTLGVYTCQAYNGIRKPASWSVILQAPGPVYNLSPENQKYAQYLIHPPRRPASSTIRPQDPYINQTTKAPVTQTYAPLYPHGKPDAHPVVSVTEPSPEIVPGRYTVPVKVNVSADEGPFPVGSEFSIACNVDGFPIPRVRWLKDNIPIEPNDRITISDANRLIIDNAEQSDSGTYRCQADNSYTSSSDSVDIKVAGIFIHPNCQDNTFFARCDLIVKGRFCQHQYYAKFCCRSCTEAGQLPVRGPHINETRRKRRSILSFL